MHMKQKTDFNDRNYFNFSFDRKNPVPVENFLRRENKTEKVKLQIKVSKVAPSIGYERNFEVLSPEWKKIRRMLEMQMR